MAFPGLRARQPVPHLPSQRTASAHDAGATDATGLDGLFDASPEVPARTTVPATLGLVLGVGSVVVSLWTVGAGLAAVMAVVALVVSVVGLAKASRPGVAGGTSSAVGIVSALVTGGLIGLRYLGVETAVLGDTSLRPLLDALTALLPPT